MKDKVIEIKEEIRHIEKSISKHPEMKEYRWDDGFWIFSDSKEAAEQRHQEGTCVDKQGSV